MTLGRFPNADDIDARILVAHHEDRVLGFLTFVPVFGADGWSLDMMRRTIEAPNGLTEFMVFRPPNSCKRERSEFVSLNFACSRAPNIQSKSLER